MRIEAKAYDSEIRGSREFKGSFLLKKKTSMKRKPIKRTSPPTPPKITIKYSKYQIKE